MKALACVLMAALSLSVGFLFGRAQGVQAVQEVFINQCEKLGGFAVGNKVFACEKTKKAKHDSVGK